jgi:UDP:flavonoid glycosyltransferase YjiC (YdhE family)
VLHSFRAHSDVLPNASLVVSHGGHGTSMAALAYGLPLLFLPMFGDQRMVANAVEASGAGRTLAREAEAHEIGAAAQDLLIRPAYRQAAQRLGNLDQRSRWRISGRRRARGAAESRVAQSRRKPEPYGSM